MERDNEHLWNSFIRLGEMIGDGDHEPWVTKEYKKLMKILCPPTEEEKTRKKEYTKQKNKAINEAIAERILTDRCTSCSGELSQTRSGSKVVQCTTCEKRYIYNTKKKKK